jgi:hypothetical protein
VTVTDKVERSADVTPEHVLAFCRRKLRDERGWKEQPGPRPFEDLLVTFTLASRYGGDQVGTVDVPAGRDQNFAWHVGQACDALVRAGLYARPSEALAAMAAEVVPPPARVKPGGLG